MRNRFDLQNDVRGGMTPDGFSSPATMELANERVTAFLKSVYGWMFAGLAITAFTAYGVATSPSILRAIVLNRGLLWAILIAQLGLVFFLSYKVSSLAPGTAASLFILYSALVGVTSSILVLVYTGASIASAFLIAAGMFGATTLYGLTTRRSLAGVGQFFFMGLIGLVLASIIGLFWQSSALQFAISLVGVVVFTGLTAWDSQRLKQMALALPPDRVGSYAVVGALSLYLDFINLFFSLLRLTGSRRG